MTSNDKGRSDAMNALDFPRYLAKDDVASARDASAAAVYEVYSGSGNAQIDIQATGGSVLVQAIDGEPDAGVVIHSLNRHGVLQASANLSGPARIVRAAALVTVQSLVRTAR